MNKSSDDLLKFNEVWDYIQMKLVLRSTITRDELVEMFDEASTFPGKRAIDLRDFIKACSERFQGRKYTKKWVSIVKACNPPDLKILLKTTRTRTRGHDVPPRSPFDLRLKSQQEKDEERLSAMASARSGKTFTTRSQASPRPVGTAQSSTWTATSAGASASGAAGNRDLSTPQHLLHPSASMENESSSFSNDNVEGVGTPKQPAANESPKTAESAAPTPAPPQKPKKIKLKRVPGPQQRVARRNQKLAEAEAKFLEDQEGGELIHPHEFQTKFHRPNNLALKMDKSLFYKQPSYDNRVLPQLYQFREFEAPDTKNPKPSFSTNFKLRTNLDLRIEQMHEIRKDDETNIAAWQEQAAVRRPPSPPNFQVLLRGARNNVEMGTQKKFPVPEYMPPANTLADRHEAKQLERRARKLGITRLVEAPDASYAIMATRVKHPHDWRGPKDIRSGDNLHATT
eukprot:TRINITY_DN14042_c0_g1_i1.p1 TRINITY_DN14042_c0_g1~~TRINITY_DN14042_c0_g1_i1.p1  ORF type:complete len:495 (+),score=36.77 TRINITY_DN14042_c0_g1_i1:119-1486(+)